MKPSVLLEFRAQNVRSFRDELKFSMLATTMADDRVRRPVEWRDDGDKIDVLPAAGVFGANASGKTNFLRALEDMRGFVLNSFRRGEPTGGTPQRPFRLDPASAETPSRFEIDLVLDGVRHEYGFAFDSERVVEEWAVRYPKGRAALLFRREGDDLELGAAERVRSRAAAGLLRANALFLSTAAQAGHPVLTDLYAWFSRNLLLAEAQSRSLRQAFTADLLDNGDQAERVLAMLRAADLGITGARRHPLDAETRDRLERAARILLGDEAEIDTNALEASLEQVVRLKHRGRVGDVEFSPEEESLGTLVWFGLVGPVLQALADGSVFLADELDASLHPTLVAEVIRLFQDRKTNPHRAQLIFTSHDVTVLGDSSGEREIGRDQIWFTEKDQDGSTRLYPLTDLNPRKDEAIGRRYLAGRYGATPILSRNQFEKIGELIAAGDPAE